MAHVLHKKSQIPERVFLSFVPCINMAAMTSGKNRVMCEPTCSFFLFVFVFGFVCFLFWIDERRSSMSSNAGKPSSLEENNLLRCSVLSFGVYLIGTAKVKLCIISVSFLLSMHAIDIRIEKCWARSNVVDLPVPRWMSRARALSRITSQVL